MPWHTCVSPGLMLNSDKAELEGTEPTDFIDRRRELTKSAR